MTALSTVVRPRKLAFELHRTQRQNLVLGHSTSPYKVGGVMHQGMSHPTSWKNASHAPWRLDWWGAEGVSQYATVGNAILLKIASTVRVVLCLLAFHWKLMVSGGCHRKRTLRAAVGDGRK